MGTHSSILAWRIPWTVEPGGLQSMESQRVGHLATKLQQQQKQYPPQKYWWELNDNKRQSLKAIPIIWEKKCIILKQIRDSDGGGLVAKLCLSLVTLWTVACQAPLSMGFPRQEHWSGLPFLSPGDLPYPGIEATSPALAGRFFTTEPPGKPQKFWYPTLNTYVLI